MSWTDERIDQLKAMWEKGMTASQIAEELGGVSRNAVIGKAHRLDLQARPSPVKAGDSASRRAAAPSASAAPKKPVVPRAAPPERAQRTAEPAPAAAEDAEETSDAEAPVAAPQPRIVSVGPGGFLRQGPGDQQAPIPPAPPVTTTTRCPSVGGTADPVRLGQI